MYNEETIINLTFKDMYKIVIQRELKFLKHERKINSLSKR